MKKTTKRINGTQSTLGIKDSERFKNRSIVREGFWYLFYCPITFSRKINFSCLYIVLHDRGSAKCKNGRLVSVVALEI